MMSCWICWVPSKMSRIFYASVPDLLEMFTQFRAVAPLGILAIFGQLLKLLRDQRGTGTESKGEWNMKQALVWIGALIAVGLALTYWKLLAALVVVGLLLWGGYRARSGTAREASRPDQW